MSNILPRYRSDLENLITNQVQENLNLDYKQSDALSRNSRAMSELSKDVSAFANSDGGTIIYGIAEQGHLPLTVDQGVADMDITREWIESILHGNIAPKIEGVQIVQIPLNVGRSAYAIYIPKSFRGPHQDRHSKRYYKRFNFASHPMEDYEISDIQARTQTVNPLLNVDCTIKHHTLLFLVIENISTVSAEDVKFEFTPELTWRKEAPPAVISQGIKCFGPSKVFHIFYGSGPDLFNNSSAVTTFDVRVSYKHSLLGTLLSDTFHIDFREFLGTWPMKSDTVEQGDQLRDMLNNVVNMLGRIEKRLEPLSVLTGPTGLDLSVTTIRNLQNVFQGKDLLERIDPVGCDSDVFLEILGVNQSTAHKIQDHFWRSSNIYGLDKTEGVDEVLIEKIKKHFHVVEIDDKTSAQGD